MKEHVTYADYRVRQPSTRVQMHCTTVLACPYNSSCEFPLATIEKKFQSSAVYSFTISNNK